MSADSRVGRRGGVVLRGKIRIGPILIFPFRTTPRGSGRAARCGLFSPQFPWRRRHPRPVEMRAEGLFSPQALYRAKEGGGNRVEIAR